MRKSRLRLEYRGRHVVIQGNVFRQHPSSKSLSRLYTGNDRLGLGGDGTDIGNRVTNLVRLSNLLQVVRDLGHIAHPVNRIGAGQLGGRIIDLLTIALVKLKVIAPEHRQCANRRGIARADLDRLINLKPHLESVIG